KDQSYFLSALTQEQLSECLFPLGELTKGEVKQLARELDLGVADRAESQDFAAMGYDTFVCPTPHPGPIRDRAGRILGQHEGIHRFTIGQRRGLGVSAAHPLYVTAIDAASNTVTVGPQEEVLGRAFTADHLNWVSIPPPANPLELAARIRYRHAEVLGVTR
ncbi:MAG: tRNA 2-thiouridine(34) synthase MnmA, partial [bacterium]|nr:tRNA 2-thiouridine(34) synthase MnmA [bacterium]